MRSILPVSLNSPGTLSGSWKGRTGAANKFVSMGPPVMAVYELGYAALPQHQSFVYIASPKNLTLECWRFGTFCTFLECRTKKGFLQYKGVTNLLRPLRTGGMAQVAAGADALAQPLDAGGHNYLVRGNRTIFT
jgi:hypothetical protein